MGDLGWCFSVKDLFLVGAERQSVGFELLRG